MKKGVTKQIHKSIHATVVWSIDSGNPQSLFLPNHFVPEIVVRCQNGESMGSRCNAF